MTWYPTNADDVTLIITRVLRDENGNRTSNDTIARSGAVVVDEFSMDEAEDMDDLSGIGNPEALGVSRGDISREFSFTIQGEDAELFNDIVRDADGRSFELEIVVSMEEYKDKLTGAYADTRNLSMSSGDPIEYEVSGLATGRDPGTI